MPRHNCHELVGSWMGLPIQVIIEANRLIDIPEEFYDELYMFTRSTAVYEIQHNDDRKWAMDVVRS